MSDGKKKDHQNWSKYFLCVKGHMGNRAHEQWDTWAMEHMSIRGRMMGHMGDRAHGQWVMGNIVKLTHRYKWGQG